MSVPLFPLYGYLLVKAVQICQRVVERLRPSSGGVLGRNECTVPLFPLYGYPLDKGAQIASG
jgi:hypothetical protein